MLEVAGKMEGRAAIKNAAGAIAGDKHGGGINLDSDEEDSDWGGVTLGEKASSINNSQ